MPTLRLLCFASLCLLLSACSGANQLNRGPERFYGAEPTEVINTALEAFTANNLNVTEHGWTNDNTQYVIRGNETERVFQGAEGTVQTGAVVMTIEGVATARTRVHIATTQRQQSPMASSADRVINHERILFSFLGDRLPPAAEE